MEVTEKWQGQIINCGPAGKFQQNGSNLGSVGQRDMGSNPSSTTYHCVISGKLLNVSVPQFPYL